MFLGLVEVVLHVAGHTVVEFAFGFGEPEAHAVHVAWREDGASIEVAHILLEPPYEDRIVPGLNRGLQQFLAGEEARSQQIQEEAEILFIAFVGRCREEQQMLGLLGEHLTGAIAFSFFYPALLLSLIQISAHLVRLVHDHQVPTHAAQAFAALILLDKVDGGDAVVMLLPGVGTPGIVEDAPIHDGEGLTKPLLHLPLPLVLEMPRRNDEHPLHQTAQLQLFEDETCHYGLSCTGIVGDEEADAWGLQHVVIDGFDLVGQRVHLRNADGQLRVELVRQTQTVCFDGEEQVLGALDSGQGMRVDDLDLGKLRFGKLEGGKRVVAVIQHDFNAIVVSAYRESLHLGGCWKKGCCNPLSGMQVHVAS